MAAQVKPIDTESRPRRESRRESGWRSRRLASVGGLARFSVVAVATVVALVAAPQAAFASVSATADVTDMVNGTVYAVARVGTRTVIGGSFTTVGGQPRPNAAAIRADGTVDPDFNPTVNGTVRSLAVSADASRVFIGGLFTAAGGAARANLAAVDAVTGEAVQSWQADTVGAAPDVLSLAVSGTNLYVGGRFSGIDGTRRRLLAAVGTELGNASTTFRPAPDAVVKSVAVSPDGTLVYAGGSFTQIGGQPRLNSVAELLASTGQATAFDPSQGGGRVVSIGLTPDGSRLYFGSENNSVFAYDLARNDPAWVVKMSGNTQAIAASPTEVYIGGHFSQSVTEKVQRNLAASLNPVDGTLTPWDPHLDGRNKGVWALVVTPTHLLMGGGIVTVGGVKQRGFARFAGSP